MKRRTPPPNRTNGPYLVPAIPGGIEIHIDEKLEPGANRLMEMWKGAAQTKEGEPGVTSLSMYDVWHDEIVILQAVGGMRIRGDMRRFHAIPHFVPGGLVGEGGVIQGCNAVRGGQRGGGSPLREVRGAASATATEGAGPGAGRDAAPETRLDAWEFAAKSKTVRRFVTLGPPPSGVICLNPTYALLIKAALY